MGVTMKLDYKGELHCELEHGPSRSVIETDAPLDNMGKGAAFSPTDLVGAALLSCAVTTMAIKGPKEGIPFGGVSGRVVKEMSTVPPRRIAKLAVELDMPAGLQAPQRAKLEEIARTCPVALSLSKELELPIIFKYPD
jgi:putative redox protein